MGGGGAGEGPAPRLAVVVAGVARGASVLVGVVRPRVQPVSGLGLGTSPAGCFTGSTSPGVLGAVAAPMGPRVGSLRGVVPRPSVARWPLIWEYAGGSKVISSSSSSARSAPGSCLTTFGRAAAPWGSGPSAPRAGSLGLAASLWGGRSLGGPGWTGPGGRLVKPWPGLVMPTAAVVTPPRLG